MGNLFSSTSATWQAKQRNVFITGASSGIGAELARNFAKEGANLALLGRNKDRLEEVASECRTLASTAGGTESPKIKIYQADLTVNEDIQKATRQAIEDFTGFDVAILNAGRSQGCYFEEIRDIDQIDHMMKLNVSGSIIPLQNLLPHIYKSHHSRIVFVSSIAGLIPVPYRTIYSASKFAIAGFCNTLRLELKDSYKDPQQRPKVTLVSIPEVGGTGINEGRMTFGAELPTMRFRAHQSLGLKATCEGMMKAIREGKREWGKPTLVQLLQPIQFFIPELIDSLIIKRVKSTHYRPTLQQS